MLDIDPGSSIVNTGISTLLKVGNLTLWWPQSSEIFIRGLLLNHHMLAAISMHDHAPMIVPLIHALMWTSHLLIQPWYLQLHTYKDLSQDLVSNNLTIRYFRFLELFLTYIRI